MKFVSKPSRLHSMNNFLKMISRQLWRLSWPVFTLRNLPGLLSRHFIRSSWRWAFSEVKTTKLTGKRGVGVVTTITTTTMTILSDALIHTMSSTMRWLAKKWRARVGLLLWSEEGWDRPEQSASRGRQASVSTGLCVSVCARYKIIHHSTLTLVLCCTTPFWTTLFAFARLCVSQRCCRPGFSVKAGRVELCLAGWTQGWIFLLA